MDNVFKNESSARRTAARRGVIPVEKMPEVLRQYLPWYMIDAIQRKIGHPQLTFSLTRSHSCCCPPTPTFPYITVQVYDQFDKWQASGFFVEFLHELAHAEEMLLSFQAGNGYRSTHGRLWQSIFHELLREHLHLFPEGIKWAVKRIIDMPITNHYQSEVEEEMTATISHWPYNSCQEKDPTLDEIPVGTEFQLVYNGWGTHDYYRKEIRSKNTWVCVNTHTGKRRYLRGETKVHFCKYPK